MMRRILPLAVLFTFIVVKDAFAYLDPGTGSYMLQIIIGTFAACFFVIKHYWTRIKIMFKGRRTGKDDTSEE
jgi:hypothetical protein